MAISSIIVATAPGAAGDVVPKLVAVPGISVYGVKDDQIVTVVEAQTLGAVNRIVRSASELDGVLGVYPVFAGEHA